MKHIKKKLLRQQDIPKGASSLFANAINADLIPKEEIQKKLTNNHFAYLITDKDQMIGTFRYQVDKHKSLYIPEPDLVVCLFETARQNIVDINGYRAKLLKEYRDVSEPLQHSYNFFSTAILASTTLFNALEGFVNRIIPFGFKYEDSNGKQTTLQNKSQIERYLSFAIKITNVIPQATGKDFKLHDRKKFETIINLRDLRDDFTHMKSFDADRQISYEKLYNDSLKFDYTKALYAVKDYINFYNPELIELCNCGKDF
ncbi:MAG: hypothetical protein JWQ34_2795 [Mucilaginibacter sp.]|uniref:hypothetical protein n=1 Tax=Mucilaginibacter sp. TaxID=1882438 RepID=UPI002606001B|nr:hypothetical protein [Mucilaginibacter sp.]MDB5004570.1 hypothetical protein [Mucilaginibacter sp.]